MVPPGFEALPLAPTAIEVLAESKVLRLVEQPPAEQTWNLTLPVSFESGSSNVAVSVGIGVFRRAPPLGPTSAGPFAARVGALFVIEPLASVAVVAALPAAVAGSRTTGPLPGFVYVRSSVS